MSKVRGFVCRYKNCKSVSKNKEGGISFFSFPSDPERCKLWIEAADRKEYLTKDPKILNKYYKICSLHFEDKMFANDLRNRLFSNAVPVVEDNREIFIQQNISDEQSPPTPEDMDQSEPICCFCLNSSNVPLMNLFSKNDEGLTLFERICSYFPHLGNILKENTNYRYMICGECSNFIDMVCEFNQKSLDNLKLYLSNNTNTTVKKIYVDIYDCEDNNPSHESIEIKMEILEENEFDDSNITTNQSFEPVHIKVEPNQIPEEENILDVSEEDLTNFQNQLFQSEKRFKCDFCVKSFNHKHHLMDHQRIHTGVKPYKCDICDISFRQLAHLRYHETLHKEGRICEYPGPPYKCEICDETFSQVSLLRVHIETHVNKPFECDVCHKKFKQKTHLKIHMQTHTGNKKYVCDQCDKRFTQKSVLTRHKKIHTKGKS